MPWHCEDCDVELSSARPDAERGTWHCPRCGAVVQLASTRVAPPQPTATPEEEEASLQSAETVFQPALMMESIMDELETGDESGPGTEELAVAGKASPSPHLRLDVEAFLLVLGAPPGQEKRALTLAKTVFGRQDADISLDDPAISGKHFQIEAFGREFFLRDLDSRNGTFLNGSQVRYSQVLPGDQITAGKTSLIFRLSDDRIDRVWLLGNRRRRSPRRLVAPPAPRGTPASPVDDRRAGRHQSEQEPGERQGEGPGDGHPLVTHCG